MSAVRPQDLIFYAGGECWQKYGTLYRRTASPLRGGESVGMSFSRADASTCATYVDRDGIIRKALANVPRIQFEDLDGDGVRESACLLMEGARVNQAAGSNLFADSTYWTDSAAFTLTPTTSIVAGQTAQRHQFVAGNNWRTQVTGTFTNGQTDVLYVILENVDAVSTQLMFWDNTASGAAAYVTLTWATKGLANGGAAVTGSGLINLGGGRYLLWLSMTGTAAGNGAGGHARRLVIYPTGGGADTVHSCILHHLQAEYAVSFPSSAIVTVGGTVGRATDQLSFGWPFSPQDMTMYASFARPAWADVPSAPGFVGGIWGLPAVNVLGRLRSFVSPSGSPSWRAAFIGTDAADRQAGAAVPAGNPLALAAQYKGLTTATPSVQLDFGSGYGTLYAGTAPWTSWPGSLIAIGSTDNFGGAFYGALQSVKIARGLFSLAEMAAATPIS